MEKLFLSIVDNLRNTDWVLVGEFLFVFYLGILYQKFVVWYKNKFINDGRNKLEF